MLLKPFVAVALLGSVALIARSADAKGDKLEGVWTPASAEFGGRPFPDEIRKTIKLTVEGDKYTVTLGNVTDKGTVKLKPTAKPKEMDITGTDGPNKDKTILAIYELDGDTLRICYDLTGKARPTEFKSPENTQTFLVTYKREKK